MARAVYLPRDLLQTARADLWEEDTTTRLGLDQPPPQPQPQPAEPANTDQLLSTADELARDRFQQGAANAWEQRTLQRLQPVMQAAQQPTPDPNWPTAQPTPDPNQQAADQWEQQTTARLGLDSTPSPDQPTPDQPTPDPNWPTAQPTPDPNWPTAAQAAPPSGRSTAPGLSVLDTPIPDVGQPVQAVVPETRRQIAAAPTASPQDLVPDQFGDVQLSTDEAYAACGPAAAVAFARSTGRNPTLSEALAIARSTGWTVAGGMNGVQNQQALMAKMGVKTELDTSGDWGKIGQAAATGTPVAISTPNHYFVATGYNPQDGTYYVGASGTAFKAGKPWMTQQEIEQIGGGVDGALFVDGSQIPDRARPANPLGTPVDGGQPANAVGQANVQSPPQFSPTTAEMSGAAAGSGQVGDLARGLLGVGAQAASWLGEQGQKAIQAILVTEGGMGGAVGDNGQSFGPLQFYTGGQLANFAQQHGMSMADAGQYVRAHPDQAIQWAIGTPDAPGYLGAAVARGVQQGLGGPDLATYAQRTGQVSVSPERAGQNYAALFGGGAGPIQGVFDAIGQTKDQAVSAVGQTAQHARDLLAPGAQEAANAVGTAAGNVATGAGAMLGGLGTKALGALTGLSPSSEDFDRQVQANLSAMRNAPPPQSFGDVLGGMAQMALNAPLGGVEPMPIGQFQQLQQARQEAIAANNPLRDVPVIGGATTLAADVATDYTTYLLGGPIARAGSLAEKAAAQVLGARIASGEMAPTLAKNVLPWLARQVVEGGSWGAIQGSEQPDATAQSVAEQALVGAGLGVGVGALAKGAGALRNPGEAASNLLGGLDKVSPPTDVHASTGRVPPKLVPAEAATRMYHGTPRAFDTPNPDTFDPNGLFGPGYYLTDDPRVAGGIVATGAEPIPPIRQSLVDRGLLKDAQIPEGQVRQQGYAQGNGFSGANVRAVDVPSGLKLLNTDAPLAQADADALSATLAGRIPNGIGDPSTWASKKYLGATALELIDGAVGSRDVAAADRMIAVQHVLKDAGYDGIQYAGGQRMPMRAADGTPIEHTAVVVFPESIQKLRNAVSGTQGGVADAAFATRLGGAVGGGIAGNATTPDDASPQERAVRIAAGAAGGFALGEGAVKLARPAARPIPDVWRRATTADPANAAVGAMFGARPEQPNAGGLMERFVRAWTNRNVSADRFQEQTLRAAGHQDLLNPPETLDLSAKLREMSGDGAAEILVQNELKPAVRQMVQMGGDGAVKALSIVLVHQNNVDIARAFARTRPAAAAARKFSAGLTVADSERALQSLQQELGPQTWQQTQQAADQVYRFARTLRQRMVDSGLVAQDTADQWAAQYPHWVPTRVLDYLDQGGGPKVGSKISLSDNGVRSYTLEGTTKFREDPLGSLVGLAHQVEAKARKNDVANALVALDQLMPEDKRLLQATDRPVTAGETVIQRIDHGTVERYVAPPQLAAVINGPTIAQAPGFVRAWTGFVRAVTTVLSPSFALVRNPSLDIPEYLQRELSRAGGNPLAMPHIVAELVRGYADAFQGLPQGELRGAGTQQLLTGGGGHSTMIHTAAERASSVGALSRATPMQIQSVGDIARIAKDLVTLQPVAAVAERGELGPRIASMRLAEQRGMTPVRAVLAGRTVTIDFAEGGNLAKTINGFVPFFNVGIQSTAQVGRAFHENPVGFALATAQLVGAPAVAAEAWNHEDPQRAQDYADVPSYLKDQGVVIMMPGDAPRDRQGNRKPQFWWINTRGYAPFSILAREATMRVMGDASAEDWQHLAGSLLGSVSPIRANAIADVPGSLMPEFLPGATTGVQLAMNKDFYRGTDIATKRRDENATAGSKALAEAITSVAQAINPAYKVRPSQVEFAVRDMLGGVGATALGAIDLAAGTPPQSGAVQDQPAIGGAARAFGVRSDTGEQYYEARSQTVTAAALRVLNDAGLNAPGPVQQTVTYHDVQMPLTQAEQTSYQLRYSELLSQAITERPTLLWEPRDPAVRKKNLQALETKARTRALAELLPSIPIDDRDRRVQDVRSRKEAGVR